MSVRFLFCVFLSLSPLSALVLPDGSNAQMHLPGEVLPRCGFITVKVTGENKGSDPLQLELRPEVEASMGWGSGASGKLRAPHYFIVPAGESREFEVLVPLPTQVDGRLNREFSVELSAPGRGVSSDHEYLNNEPDVSENFIFTTITVAQKYRSVIGASSHSSHHYSKTSASTSCDIADFPRDWRGYSGYTTVLLDRSDYEQALPDVLLALDRFARSGGKLVVINNGSRSFAEAMADEVGARGFGSVELISGDTKTAENEIRSLLSHSMHNPFGFDRFNRRWEPGVELGEASQMTGFMTLVFILFALIVGPVNLFYFAGKKRRARLFITTPIISAIASFVMVSVIVFKDGFGGDGARAVAIEIGEPGSNTMTVIQEQFSRTGILLSSSFEVDDHTVPIMVPGPVTVYNRKRSAVREGRINGSVEPIENGLEFSGDWFRSRGEQSHLVRTVRPSRERLELQPGVDAAPRLISSFSYPLKNVFYRTSDGQLWKTGQLEPGGTAELERAQDFELDDLKTKHVERFTAPRQEMIRRLVARRGAFVAESEQAPAIATHTAINWQSSPVLITGKLTN